MTSRSNPLRATAAIAVLLTLVASCGRRERKAIRPGSYAGAPIILISIDTLRADHLPAWGYDAIRTPNIDHLRKDGVLFRNAYSHCPLTLPSHVSLLTGMLPAQSGVRDNLGFRVRPSEDASLPQLFAKRGYATGAAVSAYVLRGETGLGRLFDWYEDKLPFEAGATLGEIQRPGGETVAVAQRWIVQRAGSPFFFFLHLYEPHAPYTPPEPFRSQAPSLYDGEIEYADSIVGHFLDELGRQKLYDRAIIVLLSDHGEGLGDHGESEHGIFVYREAIHVPLIIKLPHSDDAGSTIDAPAGLIDVLPTLTSLTGGTAPTGISGRPLFGSGASARRIFSESMYGRLHLGWSDLRSLIDEDHHYIDAPRAELYRLAKDSAEKVNVLDDDRRVVSAFRRELDTYDRNLSTASPVSPEEKAKLASLGYLTQPASVPAGALPDPKDRISELAAYESTAQMMRAGDYEKAISALREIVARDPFFTDAALRLARAYETTRQFAQAADVYRGVLARDPALTEQVAIGLATAYLNMGRFSEARSHAELAIKTNPGGAQLLMAQIGLSAGDPRSAERDARRAAADPHYHAQAMLTVAEALTKQKLCQQALATLDELSKSGPRVAAIGLRRADALVCLQRVPEAVAALREEITAVPAERDAYAQLSAIYLLQQQLPEAQEVLEQMVKVIPSASSYRLATATMQHFGHAAEAERWAQRERAAR
ncbi:MAG TPA: sulfatase-like hydrolase/transferase [Thermoanaerobaculia bacterium]|nr:sulfatase-like hydrolase/transferase [Thermoanaerobaculia bacterium]